VTAVPGQQHAAETPALGGIGCGGRGARCGTRHAARGPRPGDYNKRPVKIYTRTGDAGETGLFDGTRVSKADPRVDAYGAIDETNAWLGLARASGLDAELAGMLETIQRDLFAVGARLADPAQRIAERVTKAAVRPEAIAQMEGWIDTLERDLPPLRRFILAGGSPAGAALHLARTVCRRAERSVVALGNKEKAKEAVSEPARRYLNRLSDLLFVTARVLNRAAGVGDVQWRHQRKR
jgi:cob(I)alamin adenosyltransferase